MFDLDLSLDNEALYEGCDVHRFGDKRPRLDTPLSEGAEIIKRNARRIFAAEGFALDKKGDTLIMSGSIVPWVHMAVLVSAIPFFETISYRDASGTTVMYSSHDGPPDDSAVEPE